MLDRALTSMVVVAAACAAAALAVFAAGFAVYALLEAQLGPAGAWAAVAAIAASGVGLAALIVARRAKQQEDESEQARAMLLNSLPGGLGDIARNHPLVVLAVSVAGGALAARHPKLMRDALGLVSAWVDSRR